jgi:hypothetical protein
LKKDAPQAIPKIIAILKANPLYTEDWKAKIEKLNGQAEDAADEYLFMLAARWADDVRGDRRFYPQGGVEGQFHYINKPFKPAGQADSVKTEVPAEINIVREYPRLLKLVQTETDAVKKSSALCWIFHLVGDSHQPLHSISLYTEEFQGVDQGRMVGDRGGTWFYIRARENTRVINLHYLWDGLITNESQYRENKNVTVELLARPEHAREKMADEMKNRDIETWIEESFELAKTVAYNYDGKLLAGSRQQSQAPLLPAGYTKAVKPVAERRAVLAGYRLAAVLKAAFPE